MTPEEIKALIKAKIAGQGSAVDVGSALPAILEGIVDLVAGASTDFIVDLSEYQLGESQITEELAEKLEHSCLGIKYYGDGSILPRNDALVMNEVILNQLVSVNFTQYDAVYGWISTTNNEASSFIKSDSVFFVAVDVTNRKIYIGEI